MLDDVAIVSGAARGMGKALPRNSRPRGIKF